MPIVPDKQENLSLANTYLQRASKASCAMAVLPELFVGPYATNKFHEYAERLPMVGTGIDGVHDSMSLKTLQEAALDNRLYIIGGSIPELGENDEIYNTCMVVGPEGKLLAKHRKIHLFDVNVPGRIVYNESRIFSSGDLVTTFFAKQLGMTVGIGICYDLRFAELGMVMARKKGAGLLVYPGAFNVSTGALHWELLLKARAVDNQVFTVGCSPARETDAGSYVVWGHSMVVNPCGEVLGKAGEGEEMVVATIDREDILRVRDGIPISK